MTKSPLNNKLVQVVLFLSFTLIFSSCDPQSAQKFKVDMDAFGYIMYSFLLLALLTLSLLPLLILSINVLSGKSKNKKNFKKVSQIFVPINTMTMLFWTYYIFYSWRYSISYQASVGIRPVQILYTVGLFLFFLMTFFVYKAYKKPLRVQVNTGLGLEEHLLED